MLYDDDPYMVLYYPNDPQAYRSDKFTGFAPSPDNAQTGEYLYQALAWWSYYCIRPAGSKPSLTDRNIGCEHELGAVSAPVTNGVNGRLIGGIAAAVIMIGAGAWLFSRRRRVAMADERK
jgi:peptide/nickel transport system substrate-binding protein